MIYLASLTEEIEDKVMGYYIIKTKKELDIVVADNKFNNKVIIRRDFAKQYFTPTGLQRYINDAKSINRNLTIELDAKSDVLTDNRFIRKLSDVRDEEEILSLFTTYPKEFMDTISYLTRDELQRRNELLDASNTHSILYNIIDEQNVKISDLQHQVNMEQMNKLNIQIKLDALIKRINYQYNGNIDESKMFNIDSNSYDKVVYIKEVTRVQFVDSLVYYLKEILKILYSMPTRLLVVESYYANAKIRLYPDLVPHNKLKEIDVLSGDILMLGMQPHLMEDILKNPSNISILIILDRGGYNKPHVIGENVSYFYTASDIADIPASVPRSRIISYSEETLFIPLVEGFDRMDDGERISKYSSMEIIKRMIASIEGR